MPATAPLWLTVLLAVLAAVVGPALALIGVLWTQRASDRRAEEEAKRVDRRLKEEAERVDRRIKEEAERVEKRLLKEAKDRAIGDRDAALIETKVAVFVSLLAQFRRQRLTILQKFKKREESRIKLLRRTEAIAETHVDDKIPFEDGATLRALGSEPLRVAAVACQDSLDKLRLGLNGSELNFHLADNECGLAIAKYAALLRAEFYPDDSESVNEPPEPPDSRFMRRMELPRRNLPRPDEITDPNNLLRAYEEMAQLEEFDKPAHLEMLNKILRPPER